MVHTFTGNHYIFKYFMGSIGGTNDIYLHPGRIPLLRAVRYGCLAPGSIFPYIVLSMVPNEIHLLFALI